MNECKFGPNSPQRQAGGDPKANGDFLLETTDTIQLGNASSLGGSTLCHHSVNASEFFYPVQEVRAV
jgi:hypothetical protein